MPKLTTTTTLFVSIDFWFWYMSYKWDCVISPPASARGSHCLLHSRQAIYHWTMSPALGFSFSFLLFVVLRQGLTMWQRLVLSLLCSPGCSQAYDRLSRSPECWDSKLFLPSLAPAHSCVFFLPLSESLSSCIRLSQSCLFKILFYL